MEFPEDLRYSREHEWVRVDGEVATVGITDFAQDSLGDVVYVSLPKPGAAVTAGQACSEVESTKSVSEIYAPVSGEIRAVNTALEDRPELLNGDPYGEGWIFEVVMSAPAEAAGLLDAAAYRDHVEHG